MLLFAIFGVLATFGPALYYEIQFRIIEIRGIHYTVYEPKKETTLFGKILEEQKKSNSTQSQTVSFADVLAGSKEQILIPKDTEFSILIPKIGANARIFPNVDPADPDIFLPVLQNGVAHARGTVFPGQKGNIYLFAHSTDNFWNAGRYNAVFYLLKDLKVGDDVVIFYQNARHNYRVTKLGTVSPQEVSFITHAQAGKELLILQTCWPPGTTWQRLLVFAEPK